jgi:hypothetical protein
MNSNAALTAKVVHDFSLSGEAIQRIADVQQEVEEARKNRIASIGVFAFATNTAPAGLQPFTRIDHDLFVIWDASDPQPTSTCQPPSASPRRYCSG